MHLMLLTIVNLLLHHIVSLEHAVLFLHLLLPVALILLLLLLLHLLLLLEEEDLLDLLLSQLLVDHFLFCWEVILLNLLFTALDLNLLIVTFLSIISRFIFFLLVHVLFSIFAILLLLHLGSLKHQKLLLLLFCQLNFFLIVLLAILVSILFAILFTADQLGVDQLLELLFGQLEGIWVLLVLFLEIGD